MADDDIGSRKNKDNKEKYECELCLDVFNLYDRKPVCLVPCGSCFILFGNEKFFSSFFNF